MSQVYTTPASTVQLHSKKQILPACETCQMCILRSLEIGLCASGCQRKLGVSSANEFRNVMKNGGEMLLPLGMIIHALETQE